MWSLLKLALCGCWLAVSSSTLKPTAHRQMSRYSHTQAHTTTLLNWGYMLGVVKSFCDTRSAARPIEMVLKGQAAGDSEATYLRMRHVGWVIILRWVLRSAEERDPVGSQRWSNRPTLASFAVIRTSRRSDILSTASSSRSRRSEPLGVCFELLDYSICATNALGVYSIIHIV